MELITLLELIEHFGVNTEHQKLQGQIISLNEERKRDLQFVMIIIKVSNKRLFFCEINCSPLVSFGSTWLLSLLLVELWMLSAEVEKCICARIRLFFSLTVINRQLFYLWHFKFQFFNILCPAYAIIQYKGALWGNP